MTMPSSNRTRWQVLVFISLLLCAAIASWRIVVSFGLGKSKRSDSPPAVVDLTTPSDSEFVRARANYAGMSAQILDAVSREVATVVPDEQSGKALREEIETSLKVYIGGTVDDYLRYVNKRGLKASSHPSDSGPESMENRWKNGLAWLLPGPRPALGEVKARVISKDGVETPVRESFMVGIQNPNGPDGVKVDIPRRKLDIVELVLPFYGRGALAGHVGGKVGFRYINDLPNHGWRLYAIFYYNWPPGHAVMLPEL